MGWHDCSGCSGNVRSLWGVRLTLGACTTPNPEKCAGSQASKPQPFKLSSFLNELASALQLLLSTWVAFTEFAAFTRIPRRQAQTKLRDFESPVGVKPRSRVQWRSRARVVFSVFFFGCTALVMVAHMHFFWWLVLRIPLVSRARRRVSGGFMRQTFNPLRAETLPVTQDSCGLSVAC